jgi:hypothetical protein
MLSWQITKFTGRRAKTRKTRRLISANSSITIWKRFSCAPKRTLLLALPHRQFVWTIPKVLRVFLRHDRDLFADIGRLLFAILSRFFSQAAARSLHCAMVCSHQT